MSEYPELPADANHALLIGLVAGSLMGSAIAKDLATKSVDNVPIGGDYSDTMKIERKSGTYYIKIFPAPED
jgi:hypothetical protein